MGGNDMVWMGKTRDLSFSGLLLLEELVVLKRTWGCVMDLSCGLLVGMVPFAVHALRWSWTITLTVSSDPPSQNDVFLQQGGSTSVSGAEVGIAEQTNQKDFG